MSKDIVYAFSSPGNSVFYVMTSSTSVDASSSFGDGGTGYAVTGITGKFNGSQSAAVKRSITRPRGRRSA